MRQWQADFTKPGKCCANCKYNHREKQDTFSCTNEDSEYYASFTAYDDVCPDYEEKEGE